MEPINGGFKKIELNQKFKKTLIKFNRTKANSIFGDSDIYGIKLLARLRLNFSHLNEHEFRHSFNDMTNRDADTEATIHYLLRCRLYSVQRVELLNGVYKLDFTPQNSSEGQLLTILLYGSEKFALNLNNKSRD